MQEFFLAEELSEASLDGPSDDSVAIEIKKSDFAWSSAGAATLVDLELVVPQGDLIAVIGETGSGKSSLLGAILGEITCVSGSVANPSSVQGSIAYVPQQAWIYNATVRENILFGEPFDEARYRNAVYVSCLQTDFAQMAAGDMTEIGEQGVNLSGGQKQRISIARVIQAAICCT